MGKDLERSDRNWDGTVNWDAMSHQQLWDWFSQPRLEGMQGSVEAWTNKVAGYFQAAADEVNQALRTAGVHWEGQAAQSMQDASTPLAEHALVAKDAATLAGHTTLRQFMTAHQTAATVPEPKQVPTQQELLAASSGDLALYFADAAAREGEAREAEERARDLARSYDSGTDDDVAALPRFEPAPAATVDKAEPGSPDVIDSESFEPGNGDPGRNADTGGPGATGGEPGRSATDGSVAPRPGDPSGGGTSGQSWTPPAANQPPGPGTSGPVDTPRSTTPAPVGLVPGGPGGRASGGGPGGGPRGSAGGPGSAGRGGGPAPGPGSGVRGAMPGEGPVAGRAGGPATAGRGPGGMGMAPMGAGRGRGDDDTERTSPEYLRDHHDEFWDDTPAVAPPVIGDDDDD